MVGAVGVGGAQGQTGGVPWAKGTLPCPGESTKPSARPLCHNSLAELTVAAAYHASLLALGLLGALLHEVDRVERLAHHG